MTNLHAPYYQTVADFGPLGRGNAGDPCDYEEACNALAECQIEGQPAVVFRCDPPVGNAAGMMIDVTAQAEATVAEWNRNRITDTPDNITDPTDDRYGEMREARAMEAAE